MTRPTRVVLVTAGLVAAGAVFGGLAGALALAAALAVTGELTAPLWLEPFAVAAAAGAALGALAGPATAWLLLRHVPLGAAVFGTAAGTVAGGATGWLLRAPGPIWGAVLGFVVAAAVLRRRYSARRGPAATGGRDLNPPAPNAALRWTHPDGPSLALRVFRSLRSITTLR